MGTMAGRASDGVRWEPQPLLNLGFVGNRRSMSAVEAHCETGEGQVVLLSGEAGIGKSRLTAALLERVAGEPLAEGTRREARLAESRRSTAL
jgi:hypothetical protein